MNAVLPAIRSRGADLVVISPQLPAFLADLKTKLKLDFDILHDADNRVAETFGIGMQLPPDLIEVYKKIGVDLVKYNGNDLWRLPVPARFVLDRAGIVRAVEAYPDYTTRPEPEVTLEALRALG